MANRKLLLEPGTWWGGYHAPFFVSTEMIERGLSKEGFEAFKWEERDDPLAPLPPYVNPKADPRYKDDWESWVSARYTGKPRTVDLPHYEYVDWVLVQVQPTAPAKAPEVPGIDWHKMLLIGGLFYLLSRRRRRGR